MHTYMHTYMHTHTHKHAHTCTHTCTHTRTNRCGHGTCGSAIANVLSNATYVNLPVARVVFNLTVRGRIHHYWPSRSAYLGLCIVATALPMPDQNGKDTRLFTTIQASKSMRTWTRQMPQTNGSDFDFVQSGSKPRIIVSG